VEGNTYYFLILSIIFLASVENNSFNSFTSTSISIFTGHLSISSGKSFTFSTVSLLNKLKTLFSAIEEQIIEQMQKKFPSRYIHNGHQRKARELRTSFGSFHYRLAQLYDKVEKRRVVPLRKSGFLPKYRRYTQESTEAGIGSAVHLSYRWSSKEIARIREQVPSPSASTLHRYLQEFTEQKYSWPNRDFSYILYIDGLKKAEQIPLREKIAAIPMNKIFFPEMWKELWARYMSLNPEFQLTNIQVSRKWC